MKILVLGNEFIKEDSFAKEIALELRKEGFVIIDIKDSFQLMSLLKEKEEFVILDVVSGLSEVRLIDIDDISENKIITAHDFDAGFVLKLFEDRKIKIIGMPMDGDVDIIKDNVKRLL